MLRVSDLRKRFGSIEALKGIDLSVAEGQMLGIVGRSGAGKSTLLRMLNRLDAPTGGAISYKGRDVLALGGAQAREWRRACAMIFQQFNLVNRLDVLTNVLAGRLCGASPLRVALMWFTPEDRARAARALDRLGLLSHSFQRAETLSGGQQQRVAIARALVQEPEIVLADEPIASLDPLNARTVMEVLRMINRQDRLTVICSLHQIEIAHAFCDRIVGLAEGRVVFDALTADIGVGDLARIYEVTGQAEDSDAPTARPGTAPAPAMAV